MNTFNASSLSREGFPNKFKAYFILSYNEASKIACVAGAWKSRWAKEKMGTREGDTRARFFLVPTTSKRLLRRPPPRLKKQSLEHKARSLLGLTYKMLNK